MSHCLRYQQLSPMTVVTFRFSSMRTQFDKWHEEEYINKKKALYCYVDGQMHTDTIKIRRQWMFAHRAGKSRRKHGERKRLWNRNAMCDDYQTLVWDCFSVRDVQATAYLDRSIYKAVVDHWPEAARVVKNGPQQRAEAKTGQQSKGKGHGKRKEKCSIQSKASSFRDQVGKK